ncbi:unnamed protein product [Phaedon cochleariae]|uniref:Ribonucleases P/MRP subunit Pop8-like domain-containing protein n=1 Tax=Phaedon cochleariae TaxID=80249 RepID=A0A9N9X3X4_PHACE|nr:unnamed protein product [Phaedon cochleariae]
MANSFYIDLSLKFPDPYGSEVSPVYFKKNITEALCQLFGEVSSAVDIDLLKFDKEGRRGILRVPKSHYVKLRSSLTLASRYEGTVCCYIIHKVSPFLLGLQGDSRNYNH